MTTTKLDTSKLLGHTSDAKVGGKDKAGPKSNTPLTAKVGGKIKQ